MTSKAGAKNKDRSNILLALNKPKGYVVTRSDELGRKTVYELLPDWAFDGGWMPVGRLDLESKGLLLFTTDGKTGEALTRPGNCTKIYEIWVRGHVTQEHLDMVLKGVDTPEGQLKAKRVEIKGGAGPKTRVKVEIDEGKNRHIRRLFGALKDPKFGTPLKVVELKRVNIGGLKLDLEAGKWRYLTREEEKMLTGHLAQE
jgi:23S rRNA pseudouridine2605 synthase